MSAGSLVRAVVPEIISLFNLAAVTEVEASLAVVIALSLTVPADKELPNTIIKSMTSPVARLDANVSVEPLTVKELVGVGIPHSIKTKI